MGNPVNWFEIYVEDMARAKKFYETVLAGELNKIDSPVPGMEMWTFSSDMNSCGTAGSLVKLPGVKPGGNSVLIYFSCDDCAVEAARVTPAGGRVEKQKFSIGQYGYIALAYDTEGNMIGLHSMK